MILVEGQGCDIEHTLPFRVGIQRTDYFIVALMYSRYTVNFGCRCTFIVSSLSRYLTGLYPSERLNTIPMQAMQKIQNA